MMSCRSHCYWMIDMITSVVEIVACSWKWHCILERRCSLRYRNKELKSVKFEASSRSLEDLEIFFFIFFSPNHPFLRFEDLPQGVTFVQSQTRNCGRLPDKYYLFFFF